MIRAVKFESMYEMLLAGRCDYFPRSVAEGYGEVESVAPDQLMVYGRIIIAYRFPMYFFVGKDNAALAVRVEKGLLAALDDGSFLALLKKHPVTSKVFPLSKYKETKVFWIENADLSEQTPLAQKRYWLEVGVWAVATYLESRLPRKGSRSPTDRARCGNISSCTSIGCRIWAMRASSAVSIIVGKYIPAPVSSLPPPGECMLR